MPNTRPDSTDSPRGRFKKLLDDFQTYVEAEQENGARSLPATPALVAALGVPLPPPAARTKPASPAAARPRAARPDQAADGLTALANAVRACTACPLHKTRAHAVPGQGNSRPELLFVGEGPDADDDRQGLAFAGEAGHLLTRMIEAMGFTRDQVFITHIVKCCPPDNRVPEPAEAAACLHFLKDQIAFLQPKVMVSLGATALKFLMAMDRVPITRMRGQWLRYEGIDLMPTFHPAFLLQDPSKKTFAWKDLKAVLTKLGRTPPAVRKP